MNMNRSAMIPLTIGLGLATAVASAAGFDDMLAKQKPGLWEMKVLGNFRQICVTDKSKLDARDAVQNNPYCKADQQSVNGDNFEVTYQCDVPGIGQMKMTMKGVSTSENFHAEAHYQLPADSPTAQSLASALQSVTVDGKWLRKCTDVELKAADGLPVAPAAPAP
jgi:hypothetical protein